MKKIKIKMVDYNWPDFNPENEYVIKVLRELYEIEFSDTPDYIIDAGIGYDHLKYDCVKILSDGENFTCDFNEFDYAFGHDDISFGDRYLRLPHFVTYSEYRQLENPRHFSRDYLLNRKFCSFVVSNFKGDPLREEFFHQLSKYKRVDSGGRHLNNMGGPVVNKLDFCSQYKFNIAFENSVHLGYTTEKVMQPLVVGSVPIYYGNPQVAKDFNPQNMVIVKSRADIERTIEEIIYLDTHDDEYLKKFEGACCVKSAADYKAEFVGFLRNIFDQPLSEAKRVCAYGYQSALRADMARFVKEDEWLHLPLNLYRKVRNAMRV